MNSIAREQAPEMLTQIEFSLAHIDAELFVVSDICLEVETSCGTVLCCGGD